MAKALVLSSGGLDSSVCVAIAVAEYGSENVATLSAFYGQRHDKELECAQKIAEYYKVKHYELDLSKIFQFSNCSLLSQSTEDIPEKSYAEQIEENGKGRVSTYVPFRNGLLLATAASVADSLYSGEEVVIIYGAHMDDAAGDAYADCSVDFANAMNLAIHIGSYGKIILNAPLIKLTKAGAVKEGIRLGVPFELTWSCYQGGQKQCGQCGTCLDRLRAFAENGVQDPVAYEGGE